MWYWSKKLWKSGRNYKTAIRGYERRNQEIYNGTAIGQSIQNQLDNSDNSFESIESIYKDLEEQGYF